MNHTFTVTLYQGKTISHLNAKKEEKKQPTILDTTQSTANITNISIHLFTTRKSMNRFYPVEESQPTAETIPHVSTTSAAFETQ